MSYYKDPSDMFNQRAEKEAEIAASEYALYKQAQDGGKLESAQEHFLKSQHYYKEAEDNRKKSSEYAGKSWIDLKNHESLSHDDVP